MHRAATKPLFVLCLRENATTYVAQPILINLTIHYAGNARIGYATFYGFALFYVLAERTSQLGLSTLGYFLLNVNKCRT